MYEVIQCDSKQITLKYIFPHNDPDPPSTVSFRIDNEDEEFKVGDHIALSIRIAHLCHDCKKREGKTFYEQLNIHLCDECVNVRPLEHHQ